MKRICIIRWEWVVLVLALTVPSVWAQKGPYIGYAYPAGGKQGEVFQVKLGGQSLDHVNGVLVTGEGVSARVVEYHRSLGNQEVALLNQQLKELKAASQVSAKSEKAAEPPMMDAMDAMDAMGGGAKSGETSKNDPTNGLINRLEKRLRETVLTPAARSLSNLAWVEVTVAADAPPGRRELRLVTARGVSNPLSFYVGQFPESTREAMISATLQVLGKEASALRKRPPEEAEMRVTLPCTLNGQIASGEINSYRFEARKGQRLVFSTLARQLIPYVADAVPGWFQPVLALYDSSGKEVAYADDYQFKPDPVILFQVPADGEYVLAIRDGLYRGRQDFVYRITAGEVPFLTSMFPLGRPVGTETEPVIAGWNLEGAKIPKLPVKDQSAPVMLLAKKKGLWTNPLPFEVGTLPETTEIESNNSPAQAQALTLPIVVNGRIEKPGETDVFRISGKADDPIVIEVIARQLDSPLDSVVKLTDASGKIVAYNDDFEDLTSGTNTHHADSYLITRLPADGEYFVHLSDAAQQGGEEYGYRLRVSAPIPDYALRIVPASAGIALNGSVGVNVYVMRKDGFVGPVKVSLSDPPPGFTATPVTIPANQQMGKLTIKAGPEVTPLPVNLKVIGSAFTGKGETIREAVPCEDRMQAFFWRHLLPAEDFPVLVYDPKVEPKPKRPAPVRPDPPTRKEAESDAEAAAKPKFTPQQIAGRLRQLKQLYEEDLLTDEFYDEKVTECEAGL